ncbi:MAG: terminase family protein [Proteobacteria bacterium]|nr:terminase family protein [Pseudomonadota bacterium]
MPVADAPIPGKIPGPVELDRDPEREARSLYWRGWTLKQISAELNVPHPTVRSWKRRGEWGTAHTVKIIEDRIEVRMAAMLDKGEKLTEGDMKRIDFMGRQLERMARIRKYGTDDGTEADLNPNINRRNDGPAKAKRAEKRKNFLTDEQWDALEEDFHKRNFAHQGKWWDQRHQRTRKIKKSRQIGATWYFAREAMMKIRESYLAGGARNQIFLSASKRQALIIRRYLVAWVKKITGVDLTGDPIMIDMGEGSEPVGVYFLSTNANTSQGETGDFYFDEFFWVHGFAELKKVASAMATHKIFKRTYFSTPSSVTHEAYAFWSGQEWNRGKSKAAQRHFDVTKRNLRNGAMMPDGSWQHIVTIHDAIAGGMGELLDLDEIRQECSEEEFSNLYDCEEIDDTASSFPWSMIASARVDSFYVWKDFKPAEIDLPGRRPFGEQQVSIGYDPNKQGRDDAALAVVALPDRPGGKFRVLEKIRCNGKDFEGQADEIKKAAARYNVVDIAIDTTGHGLAVWEQVRKWFPTARKIEYSVLVKAQLVMKGQNIFRKGRIEIDAGWTDVMAAFMAIRPAITKSGKQVTYVAARNGEVGHADIAWAILHSLLVEPLDGGEPAAGQGEAFFFD